MSLHYQPQVGQILLCDFPTEFSAPEMCKRRPVVCVSPPNRHRYGLVTVVPLSTTPPAHNDSYVVEVHLKEPISSRFPDLTCWAKCDMLYTFSFSRFSCPKEKTAEKGRQYNILILPPGTVCEILTGVLAGMGIVGSIKYDNGVYSVFAFRDVL